MMGGKPARMVQLTRTECLQLLGSVPLGRVVFTLRALPAIRPVNHFVDGGDIIIRSHLGSGITSAATPHGGVVVAYEADMIDVHSRVGWSVVATGMARLVREPADIARYERALQPWVDQPIDCVIRIRPEMITGLRMNMAYVRPGGVAQDVPPEAIKKIRDFLVYLPKKLKEYEGMLSGQPIWIERTKGVALLDVTGCLSLGVTGPVLRSAGLAWDLR